MSESETPTIEQQMLRLGAMGDFRVQVLPSGEWGASIGAGGASVSVHSPELHLTLTALLQRALSLRAWLTDLEGADDASG